MSTPREQHHPPRENPAKSELNFEETELRLGLPGSASPERKLASGGVSLFGNDLTEEDDNNNGFLQIPSMQCFVSGGKRCFHDAINGNRKWASPASDGFAREATNNGRLKIADEEEEEKKTSPSSKAQVVGWPPVRSFRKNALASSSNTSKKDCDVTSKSGTNGLYVKVSMDGAPYLRKICLKTYSCYDELSSALEEMFSCFTIGLAAGKDRLSESGLTDLLHGSEYLLTYEDKDGDWMLVGDVPWEMFTDSCKKLRIMKGSDAIGLAPRAMQKTKSHN